jgi:hypothetical protein
MKRLSLRNGHLAIDWMSVRGRLNVGLKLFFQRHTVDLVPLVRNTTAAIMKGRNAEV